MEEKVTAIITTHNRIELLKRAIESVMNQTYKHIELIVVDDCSTDGTRDYCEKSEEYRYIRLDTPRGGNYARNIGIKNASGKYIAFLDDDDEWMSDKIEKQIDLIDEKNNILFVGCGIRRVGKHGIVSENTDILPEGDLSEKVLMTIPYYTSTIFVCRDLLCKLGGFDEKLHYWQDYELEIRVFQYTKVATVLENLVNYTVGNKEHKNISNNIKGWENDVAYINSKHEALINNLSEDNKKQRQILIASEGARKAEASGDETKKRKYIKELYSLNPTFKNKIRYAFNFYSYKRLVGIF